MAAQDKKSVIKDLIELGKSKGKLTTKEITDALEELEARRKQQAEQYERNIS